MIRALCLLIIVLTASCSTKREALKLETSQYLKEDISKDIYKDIVSRNNTIDLSRFNGKIVLYEIDYDTQKDTDSIRGKPPIKKEKRIEFDFSSVDSTSSASNDSIKENIKLEDSKSDNININADSIQEKKASGFMDYLHKIARLAVILFFMLLLYRIISYFYKHK